MTKKQLKIEFAPGAFDSWDGTQEELDEFVAEIQRMAESGELLEASVDITDDEDWDQLTAEEQDIISEALGRGYKRTLN